MIGTGFVWHERYMWHDTGHGAGPVRARGWVEPGEFAESPDAKRRMRNLLEASGLLRSLVPIEPRPATLEELLAIHTRAYVERVRAASDAGFGDAGDGETPIGPGSYEVAALAAGGAIAAVDAVLDGRVRNAYALVRPPGHHALADLGMGFCLFANCAIAVRHAQRARGVQRVAVVDWDVHHGNGTQAAFYDDPSVLAVSVHQSGFFPPGSGWVEERGEAAGAGFTVNVPLPPGSGTGAYLAAFERVVIPALEGFAPDLVLVASGFDACGLDPLGRQMLHSDAYRELTRRLRAACEALVLVHEGGYSAAAAPFCGLATIETLAGVRTEVEDPFLPHIAGMDGQELQPHQEAAIEAARPQRSVPSA